jgi:ketosteroid isomerase-like protein
MPEGNVEIVRDASDAFEAFMRDELSSEAYREKLAPEIELHWRDRQEYPDFPQHLRGAAEFIAFSEEYREGGVTCTGGARSHRHTRRAGSPSYAAKRAGGRESGVPIVIDFFQLWTIRDGKVWRIEYFRHRADALEAAGQSD